MANLVKTKVSILSCSILVSFFFTALQENFYQSPFIKRWDEKNQLNWNDFKGIPYPFGRFDAEVGSMVFIEFDSTAKRYTAYAGQNDILSWSRMKNSSNLLKHEQYHFNVTEIFARKLNKYLSENDLTPEEVEGKLAEINQELSVFQAKYDAETDHNLLQSKQDYWEFKIDSALHEFTTDKGIITDYLSGISATSYKDPQYVSEVNLKNIPYRGFGMVGYKMGFMIASYQNIEVSGEDIPQYYKNAFSSDTTILINSSLNNFNGYSYYEANTVNTARTKEIWDRIYNYDNRIYFSRIVAPHDSINREYEQIKNSFFKAVRFSDTRNYWIKKANLVEKKLAFHHSKSVEKSNTEDDLRSICIGENANNLIYKPPFFDYGKNLYIAYDIIDYPIDSILSNIIMINRQEIIHFKVDSTEQFIVLPDTLLPQPPFHLEFGYITKKDSTNPCFHFHKQTEQIKDFTIF